MIIPNFLSSRLTITKGDTSLYTFGKSHSSYSVEHNQRFPSHEISTKCDPALKFEPCEKHPKIKYKIIYNKVELPKPTCDPTKVRNFLIGNTKNCQFIFANSRALLSKPRKKLTLQKKLQKLVFC